MHRLNLRIRTGGAESGMSQDPALRCAASTLPSPANATTTAAPVHRDVDHRAPSIYRYTRHLLPSLAWWTIDTARGGIPSASTPGHPPRHSPDSFAKTTGRTIGDDEITTTSRYTATTIHRSIDWPSSHTARD